jgi:hypothetical protein
MAVVTANELRDELIGLMDFTVDYDFIREMFAYQGLDPLYIYTQFKKNGVAKGRSAMEMKADIMALCAIYVERGTSIGKDKNVQRMREEAKAQFGRLRETYKISLESPKTREEITLGRIASFAPHVVAGILAKKGNNFANLAPKELDAHLKFPGGGALIPRTDTLTYSRWVQWYKNFDKLVNPGRETREDVLESYARAVHTSTLFDDNQRERVLRSARDTTAARTSVPVTAAPVVAGADNDFRSAAEKKIAQEQPRVNGAGNPFQPGGGLTRPAGAAAGPSSVMPPGSLNVAAIETLVRALTGAAAPTSSLRGA